MNNILKIKILNSVWYKELSLTIIRFYISAITYKYILNIYTKHLYIILLVVISSHLAFSWRGLFWQSFPIFMYWYFLYVLSFLQNYLISKFQIWYRCSRYTLIVTTLKKNMGFAICSIIRKPSNIFKWNFVCFYYFLKYFIAWAVKVTKVCNEHVTICITK